jgi:glycosyltransferase involved in cell wall biosynthesis
MTGVEQGLVDAALARWPNQVEYRGPVYGRDKGQFFSDIDVFLFPTRYHNESWGIVLTEALSASRPVITRSRGCIPWMIRDGCGLVVAREGDYVSAAVEQIIHWIERPDVLEAARTAAKRRARELDLDAHRALPAFLERLRALGRPTAPARS